MLELSLGKSKEKCQWTETVIVLEQGAAPSCLHKDLSQPTIIQPCPYRSQRGPPQSGR
ncbi:hypothetical protein DPMN_042038 [Dreissena polymorpha]|uniref:Uncharacterized protein n=1 Tax=Dreissena polymorpha TaxID=45954 RepID=A0A9D4HUE8_DREPO|nr:hypothetical protein DPMN_042038 [Dreissena polymorpha]